MVMYLAAALGRTKESRRHNSRGAADLIRGFEDATIPGHRQLTYYRREASRTASLNGGFSSDKKRKTQGDKVMERGKR